MLGKSVQDITLSGEQFREYLAIYLGIDYKLTFVRITKETTTFDWNDNFDVFFKKFPFAFNAGVEVAPENPTGISKGTSI